MLGLFDGSLVIGLGGLASMAGLQFVHHAGDGGHGGHVGDGGHAGHLGDIGDAGHAGHMGHLGDVGHVGHLGDVGHVADTGHVGHVGDVGHVGHLGDAGHAGQAGHAGDPGQVHLGHLGHVPHTQADVAHPGHAEHGEHGDHQDGRDAPVLTKAPLWLIPSPIQVFSILIGFGLSGILLTPWLPYLWTIVLAISCGFAFERFLVRPYWQFCFRFASTPASLLQGAIATKGVAVTSFNRSGCGLVRLFVDGQDRDVLARILPGEKGGRVRKGEVLFIEGANSDNSVVVSRALASRDEKGTPESA